LGSLKEAKMKIGLLFGWRKAARKDIFCNCQPRRHLEDLLYCLPGLFVLQEN
jgi:hypothetical protein